MCSHQGIFYLFNSARLPESVIKKAEAVEKEIAEGKLTVPSARN